jgi:hypothetical protein
MAPTWQVKYLAGINQQITLLTIDYSENGTKHNQKRPVKHFSPGLF